MLNVGNANDDVFVIVGVNVGDGGEAQWIIVGGADEIQKYGFVASFRRDCG